MLIKKNHIVVAVGLLLAPLAIQAQQNKNKGLIKKASKEYASLRYLSATVLLQEALKKDTLPTIGKEMLANSYRKIKDYDSAAKWYAKLNLVKESKPEWALNYAEVLANQKNYQESEKYYQKYLALAGTDLRAANFAKSYQSITALAKDQELYKISYTDLNTINSEYSPAFYKDGLIFSSNRHRYDVTKQIFGWDETPFTDLYIVNQISSIKAVNTDSLLNAVRNDPARLSKLYKVNDDDTRPTSNDTKVLGNVGLSYKLDTLGQLFVLNQNAKPVAGKVNTKYHEGPAVAVADGSLIFTRNNRFNGKTSTSKSGINKLKLYTASGNNWETITPFPFNNNEYSVGHPAINKAGTLLIFSSDMPGGFGGVDLYYSKRSSITAAWETPVNMGKLVNTEGDEMFPSISKDDLLYFASTGHPGLGGLDIFQVGLKDEVATGTVVNLGAPLNSSVDDFGLISTADGKSGYFTSNRRGNDDIYSFVALQPAPPKKVVVIEVEQPTYSLEGKVLNKDTNLPIAFATVTLVMQNGQPVKVQTDNNGFYQFKLASNTAYSLAAEKTGFMKANGAGVTTKGLTKSELFKRDLYMSEIVIGKAIKIDNIFYDFDKFNIRPDAAVELDKLVAVLKENPTIWIELGSHTDSRGNDLYNQKLSQNRANSAVAYIISKGIAKERITAKGYGETVLVNNCANGVKCDDAAHQLNRRTEFKITKQ
jgi:outer membrane protein OmpA-like peptidoglycan-associated protein